MPQYGAQLPQYRTLSTGNISSFFEIGTRRKFAERNPTELFFLYLRVINTVIFLGTWWYTVVHRESKFF